MKEFVSLALVLVLLVSGVFGSNRIEGKAAGERDFDFSEDTLEKGEFLVEDDILYMVYDNHAEVIKFLGTDGDMDIKPYVAGKPVTALSDWYVSWYDDGWSDLCEESIDSSEHKVKRLVVPYTVKDLKILNFKYGSHKSLFEYSDTLEELVIEDGAEISVTSIYGKDYIRKLNLIDTGERLGYLGKLKSVYIGNAVKEVSKFLFCGNSMAKIEVSKDNPYYSSEDNILFDHNKTELIISGTANLLTEYTVPDTVENIDFGFQSCSSLSKIVLGKNVKSIGKSALYTESESLEIVVPFGSYAETYVKGLEADYIKYAVLGEPELPEATPTVESSTKPAPEVSNSPVSVSSSPIVTPNSEPAVSPSSDPIANPGNGSVTSQNGGSGMESKPEVSTKPSDTLPEILKKDTKQDSQSNLKSNSTGVLNAVKKLGKVKSVSATKRKKALKLKWKKVLGATGYQICYSTFSKFKKKSIKATTSIPVTLKKLKTKKKYYVKVRAYADVDGKRIYGKYSEVIKIRIN